MTLNAISDLKNSILGELNDAASSNDINIQPAVDANAIGSDAFYNNVKAGLGQSENNNSYDTKQNVAGAYGKYQFTQGRLNELGYSDVNPSNFAPDLQEQVMDEHLRELMAYAKNNGMVTDSTPPEQAAGLLWAGHLGGKGGMWKAYQGKEGPPDDFGTRPGAYYRKGMASFLKQEGVTTPSGLVRNVAIDYTEPNQAEKEALLREDALHSKLVNQDFMDHKTPSSMLDVLSTTFNNEFYKNTVTGIGAVKLGAINEANDANRKVLVASVGEDQYNALKSRYLDNPSMSFTDAMTSIQNAVPGVRLPYTTQDQLSTLAIQKAQDLERQYQSLDTGKWMDSPASFWRNLGATLGGYIPGTIAGQILDPASALAGAVGGAPTLELKAAIKAGLSATAALAPVQVAVQEQRPTVGLEGNVGQGLAGAALGGAFVGTLGAALGRLGKAWSGSSKSLGKSLEDVSSLAKESDASIKAAIPDTFDRFKIEATQADELGKTYRDNPFGSGYEGRVELEAKLENAVRDVSEGKPVRVMNDAPRRFTPSDPAEGLAMAKSTVVGALPKEEDYSSMIRRSYSMWDTIKSEAVQHPVVGDILDTPQSIVPILKKEGIFDMPYSFKSLEDAKNFLKTKEGLKLAAEHDIHILPTGEDNFTFVKPSDLEPRAMASTRLTSESADNLVSGNVGGTDVVGLKSDAPDILAAQQAKELAAMRPLQTQRFEELRGKIASNADSPLYPKSEEQRALDLQGAYRHELKQLNIKELDKSYDNGIERLANLDPNRDLDISEGLSGEGVTTIKEVANEIQEERSAYKQLLDCMIGGATKG